MVCRLIYLSNLNRFALPFFLSCGTCNAACHQLRDYERKLKDLRDYTEQAVNNIANGINSIIIPSFMDNQSSTQNMDGDKLKSESSCDDSLSCYDDPYHPSDEELYGNIPTPIKVAAVVVAVPIIVTSQVVGAGIDAVQNIYSRLFK